MGTYVFVVPQRNPILTARQVASIDQLSGGRFEFGVGVGWSEEEYEALDVPFERRGDRMNDYLAAIRELWRPEEISEYSGEFVSFEPLHCFPKPAQARLPIIVGGIIPDSDGRKLEAAGIAAVFTPKDFGMTDIMSRVVDEIRKANDLPVDES